METNMETKVLAIYPHPDDETFGSAGTLAQFVRAGVQVTYVCATLGQMGRNMGKPFFATRESLPKIREAELEAACKAIGIQKLIKLGLRDKMIEFEDLDALTDRIEKIIRAEKPSIIMTHYPGYAVHPDHNALGLVTINAIKRLPKQERPKVYAHAFAASFADVLGPPDVRNDISDVVDIKLEAIRAHKSQSELILSRILDGVNPEGRLILERETFFILEV